RPAARRRSHRSPKGGGCPMSAEPVNAGVPANDPTADPQAPLQAKPREVVLVTGISGSGKSVALHALEDAGFFCVDNLPPELLRDFLRLETQRHERRMAVAVDVRSAGSLPHLLPVLAQLRDEGIGVQSIFLDATTSA